MLEEPSVLWTKASNGVAGMEVDNDDFPVTAPTKEDLDILSAPLKAWKINFQKLSYAEPITISIARKEMMPSYVKSNDVISEKLMSF